MRLVSNFSVFSVFRCIYLSLLPHVAVQLSYLLKLHQSYNVTDWTVTSKVAAIVRLRSIARRCGVDEVCVKRRVFHLETNDCSDGFATVMVNHYRTTSGHM